MLLLVLRVLLHLISDFESLSMLKFDAAKVAHVAPLGTSIKCLIIVSGRKDLHARRDV